MKKNLIRMLAVLLALLCIMPAASLAASAADQLDLPIVYVAGKFTYIYNKNETKRLYPLEPSLGETIKANMDPLVDAFMLSFSTQIWKPFSDAIYNVVEPQYRELKLNGNGEVTNGSHIKPVASPKVKKSNFQLEDYMFTYDSRLDPYENTEKLNDYINEVLRVTGKSKVNLIGRCLGTTLITTYLTVYGCSKVETCILYASACYGVDMMGSFFSGNINFNAETINYYMDHGLNDPGGTYDTVKNMVSFFTKTGLLGVGTISANAAFDKIASTLFPRLLLAIFGTWPGHWAMVSDKYYQQAKNVTLGKDQAYYAGLITKIDKYQKNVITKVPETLQSCVNKGMRIAVVAKYNTPIAPCFPTSNIQADGTVELKTMSLGATAADMGKTLSSAYIRYLKNAKLDKYLSGDLVVDASSCLFRDSTWFIRDVAHDAYPSEINNLFMDIFHSKTQYTVNTDSRYPQFVSYNAAKDKISKITEPMSDSGNTTNTSTNFFSKIAQFIIDFCVKIMEFFKLR